MPDNFVFIGCYFVLSKREHFDLCRAPFLIVFISIRKLSYGHVRINQLSGSWRTNAFTARLNTRHIMKGRGTDRELETMPTFLMMGHDTELPRLNYTNHRESQFNDDSKVCPCLVHINVVHVAHQQQIDHPAMQVGIHREVSYKADHGSLPSPASAYSMDAAELGVQKPAPFYGTAW